MANNAQAHIILGRRKGGFLLAYRGFTYEKNQTTARKLYWRCSDPSCSVTIHTNVFRVEVGANVVVVKEPTPHHHQPADDIIARQEMIAAMSNVIIADPCASVRAAYDNVVATVSAQYSSNYIPIFQSVQSRLNRRRASQFPPVPRTIQDVAIAGEWTRTWDDKSFQSILTMGGVLLFSLLMKVFAYWYRALSFLLMERFAPPQIRITNSLLFTGCTVTWLFLFASV